MDTKWEFDAPQYIDFTQPDAFASEYDDSWFDRHTEDDDFKTHGKQTTGATGIAIGQPQRVIKGPGVVKAVDTETEGKQLRNSDKKPPVVNKERKHNADSNSEKLGPSPKKRQKLSNDSATKQSSSSMTQLKALSGDNADNSPAANTRLKVQNNQASLGSGSRGVSPVQPKKKPPVNETAHAYSLSPKPERATKPCPLTRSQSLRVKNFSKVCSTSNLKMAKDKRSSPSRHNNSSNDLTKVKTTEELELEKIAQLQKEAARMRKIAQESYQKAMNADGHIPLRSKQPATIPVLFNFKTDERIKNVDGHGSEQRVKDFTKSLREALPISTLPGKPAIHGLTRPQPFHLHTQKRTVPQQTEKYESVAERVAAFHNKTPARFRSHPKESHERSRSATKSKPGPSDTRLRSESPKLTIPKTPNLTTRGRSRPVHIPTMEEKELQEFEEHKKQQFKAHPVNQKIFEVPNAGVPKVAPKPPTVAEGFNFHYKKSVSVSDLRDTTATSNHEEEKFEFHAKPVNPKILQGTVGIKPVEPQPITVPQSPAFALRSRVRLPVAIPVQEEPQPIVKANPVPFNGVPFRPKLAHSVTVPEPFPVEERSREMLSKKEQKIQQIFEEERKAREFHARDLPSDSPDTLPPKQARPPTQPEPFNLTADERGEKYQQQFRSKQIEEEEKAAIEAARFKAGPNSVVHKEPFLPQKSNKPLTEISEFDLNTELRAVDRELFDQRTKAHEAYLESIKRQKEEEREKEEKAAIIRMRQEAVHKASGIKKYKTVVVKPSDKPLTEAKSPKFSLRLRARPENTQNTDV